MIFILFIGYILLIIICLYLYFTRKKLSIRIAEEYMNDKMNKFIIEAQLNYTPSDNIVLITEWLKLINKDEVPDEQMKLFREFVNLF